MRSGMLVMVMVIVMTVMIMTVMMMVMVIVMTVMMMIMVRPVKGWWEKLVKGNIALTQPWLLASH